MLNLLNLDPVNYVPSSLHDAGRHFRETNCYADLWIELLHAQGINPASAMGSAFAVDFEGDQWTFFKPPPEELLRLFGIDVHEMQIYRSPLDHAAEQLKAGRTIIIEVDSFYLPDNAASSYRRAHVKSSIAIEGIDFADQRLQYFHGTGYYELFGEDYRGLFRSNRKLCKDVLPPYVEIVRFDAGLRLNGNQLRRAAQEFAIQTLGRRPTRNPWLAFRDRLCQDLPGLLAGTEDNYHAYAFATVRQCGAAFELAKSFLEWADGPERSDAAAAAELFGRQASGAKTLLFKLARRRRFDPRSEIEQLANVWDAAMEALSCVALQWGGELL
jgi:Domain of unknown function (DUF1839)